MSSLRARTGGIRARVTLLLVGGVGAASLVVGGVGALAAERTGAAVRDEVDALTGQQLDRVTDGVIDVVSTQGDAVYQKVSSDLEVARDVLTRAGGLRTGGGTTTWEAVDQVTKEETTVRLPTALAGATPLGQNADPAVPTPVVDAVVRLVGGSTTLFQRMPDGSMLRVATTVETTEGRRAIGTYIPAVGADGTPNPVIAAVESGETYRGTAFVVNAYYATAYEPVLDEQGQLVGMLYVGVQQETVPALRESLLSTRPGENGHVEVLAGTGDRAGTLLVTDREGATSAADVLDADGRPYLVDALATATALGPDETATLTYRDAATGDHTVRLAYYEPWDWVIAVDAQDGDFAGAAERVGDGTRQLVLTIALAGLLVLLAAAAVAGVVGARMTRPLEHLRRSMDDLASGTGDLSARLDEDAPGEAGALARAFNAFAARVGATVDGVVRVSGRLQGTSRQVASIADELGTTSHAASEQARSAGGSAGSISSDVAELASGGREMSEAVLEISRNAGEAAGMAEDAVRSLDEAMARAQQLATSSTRIEEIVAVISAVAEQTKLLALNATIEAARAGEAGKGFAVVAGEVKELAREAAEASEDIGRRVADIRHDTGDVTAEMSRLAGVVAGISSHQTGIAGAVEQQTATTGGMQERLTGTARAAADIAERLREVSRAASATDERAAQARQAAGDLGALTDELGALVGSFRR
ncbi:methyl-accepting chemotaxis protein [uncultured Pseudokineococcus sp.]|uniref:methyl-accepting chemotaxis protein n=1 Tax=uncultured Pseudokineococcus sp. TaxID=1642928 RepID=UPI00260D601E|nr:methyl-accepting chemotaxis protein [uncultured Pseudokineococcus sp.]